MGQNFIGHSAPRKMAASKSSCSRTGQARRKRRAMESARNSRFDAAGHTKNWRAPSSTRLTRAARSCRAKFLGYYPRGFVDADYVDLERGYKWAAHERWNAELSRELFESLLTGEKYKEIAARAV